MLLVRRLFEAFVTLAFIPFLSLVLIHQIPGSPFTDERGLSAEQMNQLIHRFGLDRSLMEQYLLFWSGVLHGDWGVSLRDMGATSISDILKLSWPVSAALGLGALVLAFTTGVGWALLCASRATGYLDRVSVYLAQGVSSWPTFLVAAGLVLWLSLSWGWFPPALWEEPHSWVLPVLALALRPACLIFRVFRRSLLEEAGQDYIRTALAKGVPTSRIWMRHILFNATTPVLSVLSVMAANLLTGSFVIETMFAVPGLGRHFVLSVLERDYPLLLALTTIYAGVFLALRILLEFLQRAVDPRFRQEIFSP